jgi:hypothetical protein
MHSWDVWFSSFSSSSFSPFFPLTTIRFFDALFKLAEFYFFIINSILVFAGIKADANLFFLGVVIRFSFELVLSLSVA